MANNASGGRDAPAATAAAITGGVTITGSVVCAAELQIGGRVEGDVRCHTLFLEEGATITGDVIADRVRVAGLIEGTIEAVDLAIESAGRVMGTVTYTRLKIGAGGVVEGTIKHRAAESAAPAEPNGLKLVETGDARSRRVYVE